MKWNGNLAFWHMNSSPSAIKGGIEAFSLSSYQIRHETDPIPISEYGGFRN